MDQPKVRKITLCDGNLVVHNFNLIFIEERENIPKVWCSGVILCSSIKLKLDEERKRKMAAARKLLQLSSDESEECRHIFYIFSYRMDFYNELSM